MTLQRNSAIESALAYYKLILHSFVPSKTMHTKVTGEEAPKLFLNGQQGCPACQVVDIGCAGEHSWFLSAEQNMHHTSSPNI